MSETRIWLFILHLPYARTEIRNNRKDRRAWMSSIARDPIFSSIFSPREPVGLESTCGARTQSSSLILISIPIRYALEFLCMLHVYSSFPGPSSAILTFDPIFPFSLRLGNRSSPPLWPNEAVLSVQIDGQRYGRRCAQRWSHRPVACSLLIDRAHYSNREEKTGPRSCYRPKDGR